jgi:hypothetical protein
MEKVIFDVDLYYGIVYQFDGISDMLFQCFRRLGIRFFLNYLPLVIQGLFFVEEARLSLD